MVASGSPESARREGDHPSGTPAGLEGRVVGGRYRLIRKLGTGGMGSVYLCEHVTLGRRYALKLLHPSGALGPELVDRFRQEAQSASRIQQENVVDVLDFGEDGGGDLYYVMELLEGRTLGQVMRQDGPLPLPRALALLEQVCRALAAAHACGVIHRDVKPDNVLVERLADGAERAMLIDFGISHVIGSDRLTRHGEIIGTPEYMAPEQASGAEVDALTDVYSVGVLAFELLTGSLPLLGPTAIATLVAHQTQPPPAPGTLRAGLPPELDRAVLRALAKQKADRFQTMQALAAEVARLRASAGLASAAGCAAGASRGGGWSDEAVGTGRGGTISLAAVPHPETPLRLPEPAKDGAASSSRAPGSERPGWRRRAALLWAAAAIFLALLAGASLLAHLARRPASAGGTGPSPRAAAPPSPASAPSAGHGAPQAATASAEEPGPVAAPRPIEEEPSGAPPEKRARPAQAPAGPEPLRDPYATPADPLKQDPFR